MTPSGKKSPAAPSSVSTEPTPTKISKICNLNHKENCNEVLHLTRPPPEDPRANNAQNMEWILNLRKEENESMFKKK